MRSIRILDDESMSPRGKGRYFSLPDLTSRIFDGISLAGLAQSLLDDMIAFEAKKTGVRRSRDEARQLTDFHNHPDVLQDWESNPQDDDDYEGPEWFYGALASFVFTVKSLYGTYRYLKADYPDFNPKVIVDWGAGLGMHSLICSILWPEAKVVYFNVPGLQTEFAKEIKKVYEAENIIIKTKMENLPKKADLILSYEVLEHMKRPVEATQDMLKLNPKFVSVSYSFSAPCRGHFAEFEVDDEEGKWLIPRGEVTRYVTKAFRDGGWKAVSHSWNSRPTVWMKSDA